MRTTSGRRRPPHHARTTPAPPRPVPPQASPYVLVSREWQLQVDNVVPALAEESDFFVVGVLGGERSSSRTTLFLSSSQAHESLLGVRFCMAPHAAHARGSGWVRVMGPRQVAGGGAELMAAALRACRPLPRQVIFPQCPAR